MKIPFLALAAILSLPLITEEVYPGADELSPSRAHYFTWINNTNEGPALGQTEANLNFFQSVSYTHLTLPTIYSV